MTTITTNFFYRGFVRTVALILIAGLAACGGDHKDTTPLPLDFQPVTNAALNSLVTSNVATVKGINTKATISISGGEYAIGSGEFTSNTGTVRNGQTVVVRITTSTLFNTPKQAVLTVGDVSSTFIVTTLADTAAPVAQIMFPTPVSMTDGDSVLVRGTASDSLSGVASVTVNDVAATTSDNYTNWQVRVPLSMGANTLTATVKDSENNTISAVANITRAVPSTSNTPSAENPFSDPTGIVIDAPHNRVLVVDYTLQSVLGLDFSTGARSVLSNNTTPNAADEFNSPSYITLDAANNRAFVAHASVQDGSRDPHLGINTVDLTTGARHLLSDNTTPNAINPFSDPSSIVFDSKANRVLVTDFVVQAIIAVDATTGARTILSSNTLPDTNNPFSSPLGITLDYARNRALVTDLNLQAVIAVDLTSGARTILSSSTIPNANNALGNPIGITLDTPRNRALLVDFGIGAVVAVDLTDGTRSILSDGTTPNSANALAVPLDIVVDSIHNRALVTEGGFGLNAIMAVDLLTGERVYFSK
ncbi:MAG: hypothetical protein V4732_12990 [Pseudomonadota bacterium]